jgi:hypothetical protein
MNLVVEAEISELDQRQSLAADGAVGSQRPVQSHFGAQLVRQRADLRTVGLGAIITDCKSRVPKRAGDSQGNENLPERSKEASKHVSPLRALVTQLACLVL